MIRKNVVGTACSEFFVTLSLFSSKKSPPMPVKEQSYRSWLLDVFNVRKAQTQNYSLRAFARDLAMSPTVLSDVLNRKRHLSRMNLERLADHLGLSPIERERILSEIRSERRETRAAQNQFVELAEDEFRLIADWYHLAILNVIMLPQAEATVAWIATRLNISEFEVKGALERLERMQMVECRGDHYFRVGAHINTSRDIPSAAIQKHHTQNLMLAQKSLSHDAVDVREFSSMTMAVNPQQLREAKEMMTRFKRRLARRMQRGTCQVVYTISMQLFPVTKLQGKKSNQGSYSRRIN